MFGRVVVVSMLVALIAGAGEANADPGMDAMLDGMERLCGERYAGALESRDRNHLRCMRAYTAHCALKGRENPVERGALTQLCKSIPECPHCVGAAESAERCVVEFKRYKRPSPSAESEPNKCERYLVDGMAHAGAPEVDVQAVLVLDPTLRGRLPDCRSTSDGQRYRSYCMCVERNEIRSRRVAQADATRTGRGKEDQNAQADAPGSRKEWEKAYRAALAKAEAAGCDLVLTR